MGPIAPAIHRGCGVMRLGSLPEAVRAGWRALSAGRRLDAVEAAVRVLEDSPLFNASHGAALSAEGEREIDASIMDREGLRGGGAAAARRANNPVRAARAVLEGGEAVILAGPAPGAHAGARRLDLVDPSHFTTERRRETPLAMRTSRRAGTIAAASEAGKHGTVGAVALDRAGRFASATSTGEYTDKPAGRVGDSPIPGAGVDAMDGVCAASGTGQGKSFVRHALAHDIAARMAFRGDVLNTAARALIDGLTPDGEAVVATHVEPYRLGRWDA